MIRYSLKFSEKVLGKRLSRNLTGTGDTCNPYGLIVCEGTEVYDTFIIFDALIC